MASRTRDIDALLERAHEVRVSDKHVLGTRETI
jgi:hypothetical protein